MARFWLHACLTQMYALRILAAAPNPQWPRNNGIIDFIMQHCGCFQASMVKWRCLVRRPMYSTHYVFQSWHSTAVCSVCYFQELWFTLFHYNWHVNNKDLEQGEGGKCTIYIEEYQHKSCNIYSLTDHAIPSQWQQRPARAAFLSLLWHDRQD